MQKLIKYKIYKLITTYKIGFLICLFLIFFVLINFNSKILVMKVDSFLTNIGFSLTEVEIVGNTKFNENDIKKHIKYRNCSNLFCIDLIATKRSLTKLGWVKNANIKLILPSRLLITILEEEPKFILDKNNSFFLLNNDGDKIMNIKENSKIYKNLVFVSGDNVSNKIKDLKIILDISPDLSKKITSAKLVSNRRWSLILSNLITIDLPEIEPELAFQKLDKINKRYGFLSENLKKVDLRIKNRMIIKFNFNDYILKESKI